MKQQDIPVPWDSLKAAARQGSLQLTEAIRQREPEFYARAEPKGPRGSQLGNTEIKVALRSGNLHYIDYLLGLGADLNEIFPEQSSIRTTVRADIDDGILPTNLFNHILEAYMMTIELQCSVFAFSWRGGLASKAPRL